jgi:hypothetical protein
MKSSLTKTALNCLKFGSLSLLISSSFLIAANPAQASWEGRTAAQIVRMGRPLLSKIKLPRFGNNKPQIMQYQYRLPNGQIVLVCQATYPNGSVSEPYYC